MEDRKSRYDYLNEEILTTIAYFYEKKDERDKAKEYFQKASNSKISYFSTVSKEELESKLPS
ncbi:MAG: hypothetical protein ACLFPF_07845 [Halanaerobiales bacterium]